MTLQSFVSGLIAGAGACLVVAIGITEVTGEWVDFSLLVGLPSGIVAGVAVAAVIHRLGAGDHPDRSQRIAASVLAFAGGFLLAYFVVTRLLDVATLEGIGLATAVGVIAALVALVRDRLNQQSR